MIFGSKDSYVYAYDKDSGFREWEYRTKGPIFSSPVIASGLARVIKSMGVTYPILRDINSELMSELNVTAVPTLLIYDSSGELPVGADSSPLLSGRVFRATAGHA